MDDKFYEALSEIRERLSAHTVLLVENGNDIKEINETLKIQNGSIKTLKVDVLTNINEINNIKSNCGRIQDGKKERKGDVFKAIAIGLTLVGLLFGTFKLWPNKVQKEILYVRQINDSTMVISPAIDIRSNTDFKIDTISSLYFKIDQTSLKN